MRNENWLEQQLESASKRVDSWESSKQNSIRDEIKASRYLDKNKKTEKKLEAAL